MQQSFLVERTYGKQISEAEQQCLQNLSPLEIDHEQVMIGREPSKYVCLHFVKYQNSFSYACTVSCVCVCVCVCKTRSLCDSDWE